MWRFKSGPSYFYLKHFYQHLKTFFLMIWNYLNRKVLTLKYGGLFGNLKVIYSFSLNKLSNYFSLRLMNKIYEFVRIWRTQNKQHNSLKIPVQNRRFCFIHFFLIRLFCLCCKFVSVIENMCKTRHNLEKPNGRKFRRLAHTIL